MDLASLKKNLKKDLTELKPCSVALLADSASQMLAMALKGWAIEEGFQLNLFEADYDQIPLQIHSPSSEFNEGMYDFVLIHESSEKLLDAFYKLDIEERRTFAEDHLTKVEGYIDNIRQKQNTKVLYFNFAEINDSVFGNFANAVDASFLYQLRKINLELMQLTESHKNLFLVDISTLQNSFGRQFTHSPSIRVNTSIIFSMEAIPLVAKAAIDVIKACMGKIKKCLILDLDNTTWGGIIGDDGLEGIQVGNLGVGEAFSRLQRWAKELKKRGIILAVCSNNEEAAAMEPFEKHPEMVLRMEDIAVFVANWDNKADNIRYIQSVLNIGFDSMVFLDDNPVERKIVRDNLPEVTVPELPEDPAEYLTYLQGLNLFETASFAENDEKRTKQYQEESKRAKQKMSFVNEGDFLKSLHMVGTIAPFQKMDFPRIAQLSQRSNQFNLRTIRYDEQEVEKLSTSKEHQTFTFKLKDAYGDYGLVSIVVLKKEGPEALIENWLMSCRVLKRGLENLVLNALVDGAKKLGCTTLKGEYLPTAKNAMVKDHYAKLGFIRSQQENTFHLELETYQNKEHFIAIEHA
ncbi:MAG: HAD-IIIC family phosphatase [Crocinitomicaceae bacterium]|jgi:FkbH-like protein|nr:HAD-IIIC family phosphatase [Crocinitomicaceae bacterium]